MKKIIVFLFIFTIFCLNSYGISFTKKASSKPLLVQKGDLKQWCPVSGLKIEDYYKTSYIAKLKMNQNIRQYSSLFALVLDMKEYGIDMDSIKVLDVVSQKYIDVKGAYFLVDSKIKGTISSVSKLGFKNIDEAKKFQKRYKGKIVSFDLALNMAKESLSSDIKKLKNKNKKREYPRGKKIYEKVCKKDSIDPSDYIEINELKADILKNKICKPLKEKDLHSLSLYLFDVKRFGDLENIENRVIVKEDEKCPVCGMFTYKYPKWAAQIFYEEGDLKKHYSFDGVKDLMKFYFDPMRWGDYKIAKKKNIKKILVTDYYSQQGIDGVKAYYVIRSDVYGPMGHEFIPFKSLEDAKIFKKDHFGKKILNFKQITEEQTYKLDESE